MTLRNKYNLEVKLMDVREDFCGMCMAVPIALAGAGMAGLATKNDYQNQKYIMISIGVAVLVVSFILLYKFKDCKECTV